DWVHPDLSDALVAAMQASVGAQRSVRRGAGAARRRRRCIDERRGGGGPTSWREQHLALDGARERLGAATLHGARLCARRGISNVLAGDHAKLTLSSRAA